MMYYVNKIVTWLLSPLGLSFLGLAAGALLLRVRAGASAALRRQGGKALVVASLAFLWLLSCSVTTRIIGVPLEGEEYPLVDRLDVGGVDAIVLLGGGIGVHETCGRCEMFLGADRVWEAARLWKRHHTRSMKLVASGTGAEESTLPLLKDLGVNEDDVVYLPKARNTEEEAKMLYAAGFRRIFLVTSAWHMPRARALFERAGLEVQAAPTDYEMHYVAECPLSVADFFPSADALLRNSLAVKEWIARVLYALKG